MRKRQASRPLDGHKTPIQAGKVIALEASPAIWNKLPAAGCLPATFSDAQERELQAAATSRSRCRRSMSACDSICVRSARKRIARSQVRQIPHLSRFLPAIGVEQARTTRWHEKAPIPQALRKSKTNAPLRFVGSQKLHDIHRCDDSLCRYVHNRSFASRGHKQMSHARHKNSLELRYGAILEYSARHRPPTKNPAPTKFERKSDISKLCVVFREAGFL
jgi:hypothetical protein